jgi:chromosome segregation ATPase
MKFNLREKLVEWSNQVFGTSLTDESSDAEVFASITDSKAQSAQELSEAQLNELRAANEQLESRVQTLSESVATLTNEIATIREQHTQFATKVQAEQEKLTNTVVTAIAESKANGGDDNDAVVVAEKEKASNTKSVKFDTAHWKRGQVTAKVL